MLFNQELNNHEIIIKKFIIFIEKTVNIFIL